VLMLVLRLVVGSGKFWVRGLSLARGDPKTLTQRDVDAYRRPMAVRNWAGGILNFTRSMVLERQTEVLCLIGQLVKACPDLPVLIVHGSRDRIIPLSNSQVIARQIPRATLIVMPGKGHVPHEEDGEEFASIVDKWLRSTTLAPESQR
jgi:pimeloyl-ACP methyl ester carboxylesterase